MVLTSNGDVLTNNHVIDGATSITATIVSSGATYSATVVGTDPSAEVAVLHLQNASGLARAALSASPRDRGRGGDRRRKRRRHRHPEHRRRHGHRSGSVDHRDESNGSNAEQLSGLIQTDAGVQPGDSGGPLYDSAGAIVGMDTATSSGGTVQAYAVLVSTAEDIATQIEQGATSTTIHEGLPAFLGVSVSEGQGAVTVLGVLPRRSRRIGGA